MNNMKKHLTPVILVFLLCKKGGNMTLEELEILIKTKIEDAKPQITKMLNQVKGAVNNSRKEIQSAVNITKQIAPQVANSVNTAAKYMNVYNNSISSATKQEELLINKIQQKKKLLENAITPELNDNQIKEKIENKLSKLKSKEIFNPDDISDLKISGILEIKGFKTQKGVFNKVSKQLEMQTEPIQKRESTGLNKLQEDYFSGKATYDDVKAYKGQEKLNTEIDKSIQKQNIFTAISRKLYAILDSLKLKFTQIKGGIQENISKQNQHSSVISKMKSMFKGSSVILERMKSGLQQTSSISQRIVNKVKNVGGGFKTGLKHVLKYAMALFSLRGIYSVLSNSARSWLSSQNSAAKQMTANIEYMKYAMGSAFAPVIQYIINLVYKLMKAIQSVVYALTGVNIFAKASAKSYNAMANSARKAKKETQSLADIDEIHNIQKDNSNSDTGATTPNMDLSKLGDMSGGILNSLKNGDWGSIGSIIAQRLNETLGKIPWDGIQNGAKKIANNITNFLNSFISTANWNLVGNTLAQGLNTAIYFLYTFITTFNWSQFGTAIGTSISGFIQNIDWATAGQLFGEGVKGIFNTISSIIENIDWVAVGEAVKTFIQNIDWAGIWEAVKQTIKSAIGAVDGILTGLFGENTATIIEAIATAIAIVVAALWTYNAVMTAISIIQLVVNAGLLPIIGIFLAIVVAIAAVVAIGIALYKNWDKITSGAKKLWTNIKPVFQKIGDFIGKIFKRNNKWIY